MAIVIGTAGRYEWGGYVEEIAFPILQSDPAFGMVHRRAVHPNKSKVWRLSYQFATLAEKDAFLAEFNTAKGSAGEITFTPPGSASSVTARFLDDALSWGFGGPALRSVAFNVVQDVVLP